MAKQVKIGEVSVDDRVSSLHDPKGTTLVGRAQDILDILQGKVKESRNLRGDIKDTLVNGISELRDIISAMNESYIDMALALEDARSKDTETALVHSSCTEATAKPMTASQNENIVLIYNGDSVENKRTPEQLKQLLKSTIKPQTSNIGFKQCRAIKDGFLVNCCSSHNAEKFKELVLENLGSQVILKTPRTKMPRLVVYGLPSEYSDSEVRTSLISQNSVIREHIEKFGEDTFKIKFPLKSRENARYKNWVLEVDSKLRSKVLDNEFLCTGWQSCKVRDFLPIIRCYNCAGFGHIAKFCRNDVCCPICAGPHQRQDCVDSNNNACVNCLRHNAKSYNDQDKYYTDHAALDANCPCFRAYTDYLKDKIFNY